MGPWVSPLARAITYLTESAPWVENPSRLVNLEELMRQFDARRLMVLISVFAALRLYESSRDRKPNATFSEQSVQGLLKDLEQTVQLCTELGLIVGRQKANSIIHNLTPGDANPYDISNELGQLDDIIHTELESHVFLFIEPTKAHLYSQQDLFGTQVAAQFPSASVDLEEAGKCLALNRGTACVFHLMRIMEIGLYSMAEALQVSNIQENWHNAIEQIERVVRGLPRGTPTEKESMAFYSDAAAQLFNVKEAWRNRTAHSGHIYTEEKAQQIFDSIRGFMQALATRLSDKPL